MLRSSALPLALILAACGGADAAIAPPPSRSTSVSPDEIAAAFANEAEDRWTRFGSAAGPFRLEGVVEESTPLEDGTWRIILQGRPRDIALGGVHVPPRMAGRVKPGAQAAAYCAGVEVDFAGPNSPVLESRCWLARDFYFPD